MFKELGRRFHQFARLPYKAVGLFSGFRISGLGLGFRVQGFGFRVLQNAGGFEIHDHVEEGLKNAVNMSMTMYLLC